jgi:DNA-binding winged helix-turn-helix (wHTH) protein
MVYRFENFELDLERVELRRAGKSVPMEPQVFALLTLLVENPERMVSKDEIHDRIWSGRVVSDAALNSRIRSARQAVGDDGKAQRLIRTVRSNGFRFVGTVSTRGPAAPSGPAPAAVAAAGLRRPCIAVLPFENQSESARISSRTRSRRTSSPRCPTPLDRSAFTQRGSGSRAGRWTSGSGAT